VIRFVRVSKSFDSLEVLRDLSFDVGQGQILGVIGPSGSGKTTILKLITGILRPDSGQIELAGDRIGYVFQEPRLLPWRTVLDNIALVMRSGGLDKKAARDKARIWTQDIGLEGFEDYYPMQLSGGMMQRVSLGRALASRPDILLMDEPFSNMDKDLKESLLSTLRSIIQEHHPTVVYVTHEPAEVAGLADRILELAPERGLPRVRERT
jgi:NitT/TauT family transport system ATP-binding protein